MAGLAESNETRDVCSAQWLLLWTTAAYAPEQPSRQEAEALDTFYTKFQDLCREGPYAHCLRDALRDYGRPPTGSRRQVMLWLCAAENRCLQRAGLPTKRCRYSELMGRWRYADGYL
uniref:Sulfhydryl oxidase n=1 Tax=Zooxanthella nutricula TaxID=1333877 RepID=A0A7S2LC49_9DINO